MAVGAFAYRILLCRRSFVVESPRGALVSDRVRMRDSYALAKVYGRNVE